MIERLYSGIGKGAVDAVEISHVSKTFGDVRAVNDLSLNIPEGAVYGFIGPNGSGKTTTMRMIVNIFYPDSGEISVFGKRDIKSRPRIGYLPEEHGLYRQMNVQPLLEFYAELQGGKNVTSEVTAWLQKLGLAHCAERKLMTLEHFHNNYRE